MVIYVFPLTSLSSSMNTNAILMKLSQAVAAALLLHPPATTNSMMPAISTTNTVNSFFFLPTLLDITKKHQHWYKMTIICQHCCSFELIYGTSWSIKGCKLKLIIYFLCLALFCVIFSAFFVHSARTGCCMYLIFLFNKHVHNNQ